jgi:hypothetical protein
MKQKIAVTAFSNLRSHYRRMLARYLEGSLDRQTDRERGGESVAAGESRGAVEVFRVIEPDSPAQQPQCELDNLPINGVIYQ